MTKDLIDGEYNCVVIYLSNVGAQLLFILIVFSFLVLIWLNIYCNIQRIGKAPDWGMGPPTHLKILNPEGLLSKGNMGTKCGAEIEGKAIQRLSHLGTHPIYRHQSRHYC